ncbi:GNAT family N-acetyltransferase [Streptomyces sp. NPDC050145]|uniref:GNAT family N-acetyltransferase n=1 Tax=Streptomyces sp. NPDC050145 TaxID=3365602 RepID=UPI0037B07B11
MTVDARVRDWVGGWVLSRGATPPLPEPWGFTVHVGLASHVSRHVLGAANDGVREDDVRRAARSVRAVGAQLKVFADPERVLPWLGPEWEPYDLGDVLMTTELTDAEPPAPPAGYHLHTWTRDGVTRVLLTDTEGSFAARGQTATTGASTVVDMIETSEDHRRRGLGRVVMGTLQAAARAQGARQGVLAGTPSGRLLYRSLGWHTVAPLTNARLRATTAA